jgi:MscS family membrane protein
MDTGKTAHVISVDYFTSMDQSLEEFNSVREAVNLEIINLMEQKGIQLAAAHTDVVIRSKNEM